MKPAPESELYSAFLDGELTPAEQERMELLLERDAEAATLVESLRSVRDAIQSLPSQPIPVDLTDRVLKESRRRMESTETVDENSLDRVHHVHRSDRSIPQERTASLHPRVERRPTKVVSFAHTMVSHTLGPMGDRWWSRRLRRNFIRTFCVLGLIGILLPLSWSVWKATWNGSQYEGISVSRSDTSRDRAEKNVLREGSTALSDRIAPPDASPTIAMTEADTTATSNIASNTASADTASAPDTASEASIIRENSSSQVTVSREVQSDSTTSTLGKRNRDAATPETDSERDRKDDTSQDWKPANSSMGFSRMRITNQIVVPVVPTAPSVPASPPPVASAPSTASASHESASLASPVDSDVLAAPMSSASNSAPRRSVPDRPAVDEEGVVRSATDGLASPTLASPTLASPSPSASEGSDSSDREVRSSESHTKSPTERPEKRDELRKRSGLQKSPPSSRGIRRSEPNGIGAVRMSGPGGPGKSDLGMVGMGGPGGLGMGGMSGPGMGGNVDGGGSKNRGYDAELGGASSLATMGTASEQTASEQTASKQTASEQTAPGQTGELELALLPLELEEAVSPRETVTNARKMKEEGETVTYPVEYVIQIQGGETQDVWDTMDASKDNRVERDQLRHIPKLLMEGATGYQLVSRRWMAERESRFSALTVWRYEEVEGASQWRKLPGVTTFSEWDDFETSIRSTSSNDSDLNVLLIVR